MRGICTGLLVCCLSSPVMANDALQLLNKAVMAARKLNYSGTFVYQHGSQTETSRIAHAIEGGKEYEHLEVLDGSPREVVREGEEVKCYLPDTRTVFIEKKTERGLFPALLPASLAGIGDHYHVRFGAIGRVAGLETQSIILEPKDEFRYGHQFWIDTQTGLMLKAALTNDRNEVLESFAFTEMKIGGAIALERLRARQSAGEDWKVMHGAMREGRGDDAQWAFRQLPPGFVRASGMRRQLQLNSPETRHYIFSDGLASISVFIETLPPKAKAESGVTHMGAIHAYRRVIGNTQITVMGEVPAATVRRVGDGVEPRRKS